MIDTLKSKLLKLNLKVMAASLQEVWANADKTNQPFLDVFDLLVDRELENREKNRIALRFAQSGLYEKLTIDQFDFHFHTSRKQVKTLLLTLLSLDFLAQKKDIIFIGAPGVGKTYLAKCLAYRATQANKKTCFTTAMEMINHLVLAEAEHTLLKKLKFYQTPDLLVIDELGYLPLGAQGSNLFFQVISARHERKSTLITTNRPFSEWGFIFDSTTTATAIADRLVFNSEIIILEGMSYRSRRPQRSGTKKDAPDAAGPGLGRR